MSTSPRSPVEFDFSKLAPLLFAANGIESGLWQIGVKMRFAGLNGGFTDELGQNPAVLPTALVGFESLVLTPVDRPGPLVFDAASGKETGTLVIGPTVPEPAPVKQSKTKRPAKA